MLLRKFLLPTLSAATMVIAVPQTAMAADEPQAEDATTIGEVIVSARRRDESILETPLAITAVTSEDLEAKGITSFNQLVESTPGVNLSNASAGAGRNDRSFQQVTLRGMVPSSTQSTLTATFIDGVPVASATAVASVADPARVEILKGPQAAYFGRNTFAGAINVVNKDPGNEFGGSLLLMGGNRSNLDFTGSLHGPISEKFGFRVNAKYFKKDGSYENAANPGETLGDQETRSVSLLLTAKPIENLSAKLFLLHSEDDDGAPAQGLLSAYEMRANNGLVNFPAASGSSAGTILLANQSNCTLNGYTLGRDPTIEARVSRPFICGAVPGLNAARTPAQNTTTPAALINRSLADPTQRIVSPSDGVQGYGLVRTYQHAHLNIDYEFGDSGFTLSSLSGLNAEFYSELQDLDNYDSRALTNAPNPGGANPNLLAYWDLPFMVERETYDFSQELRLAYDNDGAFSGIFGISYLKTSIWNDLINVGGELQSGASRNVLSSAGKNEVETKGVFFGANYQFTDALKLSFEGRYQEDLVVGRTSTSPMGVTVSPAAATAFGIPAGFYGPLAKLVDETYKEFLPRLIVQYDFNDDLMGYASYSKGVNVGANTFNTAFLSLPQFALDIGINELGLTVVQKPEKLTNYEIGFKGKLADGKIQFQSAIYYAVWKDQLNNRSRTVPDRPIAQGGNGTTALLQITGFANTGETKLKGIELEVIAKPTEHLELGIAGAMNESEIQSFINPLVSQLSGVIGDGFRGKQLPLASKYSANLSAQYGMPISAWEDGSWFVRGDLSWKDKQFLNPANITWIKARSVVNFRAGVTRGPLSVDAYVLNAFDDDNYVAGFQGGIIAPAVTPSAGAESYVIVGLPELRSYGARIAYKF